MKLPATGELLHLIQFWNPSRTELSSITQGETDAEKAEKPEEKSDGEKAEEKEADKKPKLQKKSKISEDITVELEVNDVLNPSTEDMEVSKKK